MRIKTFYINICLLTSISMCSFALHSQDSISLDQVRQLVLENSIASKSAQSQLTIADLSYKIFKTNLLPSLTINAQLPNFSRSSQPVTQPDGTIQFQGVRNDNSLINFEASQTLPWTGGKIFLNSNFQRFSDIQNNLTQFNGRPLRIGISQPINTFNPLKWDKRIEKLNYSLSTKRYNADIESSVVVAISSFFDVLILSKVLESAKFNANTTAEILVIAQEKYNLGKISNNDFLQLQLNEKNAENQVRNIERTFIASLAFLHSNLNLPYDGSFLLPILPSKISIGQIDKDFAIDQAIKNRPEVMEIQRNILAKERDLRESKKTNGFQGEVFATFGLSGSSATTTDLFSQLQQDQLFSVGVSVPILNWGKRKSQIGISKIQLQLEKDISDNTILSLQNELIRDIESFDRLIIELESTEIIREIATERYEIAKESFVLGSIGPTELSISQTQRDDANRNYINTLGEYWKTYYNIRLQTLYDFENQVSLVE